MAHVFAGIMTFGKFANSGEIVAFKTLGVNFYKLLKSLLIITAFIMLLLVAFNNTILPNSNHRLKNLMLNVYRFKPTYQLEEGIFLKNFGKYSFFIEKINRKDDTMKNIYIYQESNGYISRIIIAKKGKIIHDVKQDTLWLLLKDGSIHDFEKGKNEYHIVNFKTQNFILPINEEISSKGTSYRGDRELDIFKLVDRIKKTKMQMKRNIPKRESKFMDLHYRRTLNRLYMEIYKKITIPLTSIFLLMLGAGIGARIKNSNIGLSLTISLGIYGIFYIMMIGGESLSSRGIINPIISAIVPLITFGVAAIITIAKAMSEYSVIKTLLRKN
jgi:lipopolysaccharide export LptBFGC system permease protein LptF